VVENIVIEAIYGKQIAFVVNSIDRPIIAKLFGTQHQNTVISEFIIFYDGQGFEGFTQAYAVRDNAA